MNMPTITFILGGILLLASILGGGFEVRELKIPKVNGISRLIAAVVGAFFILCAIGLDQNSAKAADAAPHPTTQAALTQAQQPQEYQRPQQVQEPQQPPQQSRRINFYVQDELSEGQLLETTRLYINGSDIGQFTLNPSAPRGSIAGWATNPGSYNYQLRSSLLVAQQNGQRIPLSCHGEGVVHLVEGARYTIRLLGTTENDCQVDLVGIQ